MAWSRLILPVAKFANMSGMMYRSSACWEAAVGARIVCAVAGASHSAPPTVLDGLAQLAHELSVGRARDDAVELAAVVVHEADAFHVQVVHSPARAFLATHPVVHRDLLIVLG